MRVAENLSLALPEPTPYPRPTNTQTPATTPSSLWLCLYFPELVLRSLPHDEGVPFAVLTEHNGHHEIYIACAIAQTYGIAPGMPLNTAFSLCRRLNVQLRNMQHEQQMLETLAELAHAFTPHIVLEPPDSLLLEISGSLTLFNGVKGLKTRINEIFEKRQQLFSIAISPTPIATLLLARNGIEETVLEKSAIKSVLGALTLSTCSLPVKLITHLSNCGLYTLRDLWRLPSNDLARRFGITLVNFLDRACGVRADPRHTFTPSIRFYRQLELPTHTADAHLLCTAAERLLTPGVDFLHRHDMCADIFIFQLWHSYEEKTLLKINLQKPDRTLERILRLFKQQLESTTLTAMVIHIALSIEQVTPFISSVHDLFDHHDADEQDWQQLLEVIQARLGKDSIYGVSPVADHRPENAWRALTPDTETTVHYDHNVAPDIHACNRPILLLPNPKNITGYIDKLTLPIENERIESGWWDDHDVRREYYIATSHEGARWWVFQELNSKNWYLHGLFS